MPHDRATDHAPRAPGRKRRRPITNPLVGAVCLIATLLGAAGFLCLFTALEGLVRATIALPVGCTLLAALCAVSLARRIHRRSVRATSLAILSVNGLVFAGLAGCSVLAPFTTEELRFDSGEQSLAATLYLPRGDPPFPAVALVHGSTRQTRNSLGGLYRTNAIALARRGIAALVYDKRGCGQSSGDFEAALIPDFAEDARAAVAYLATRPDIAPGQVGLWGISAGGWAAPLAARSDSAVAFLILVSAPAVPEADQRLFEWAKAIRADGASEPYIASALAMRRSIWQYYATGTGWNELTQELDSARRQPWWSSIHAVFPDGIATPDSVSSPDGDIAFRWHRTDCFRDPVAVLRDVKAPILAIYGSNDTVIDLDRNTPLMRRVIDARSDASRVRILPDANHGMLGGWLPPQLKNGYADLMATWTHSVVGSSGAEHGDPESGGDR
ncbi:MAG: alpha/beta fold hydrolase [Phycisphaeraceae bacterium]|nr:alpha/beta fold hydrolase [Phycisphaeraceae bacterium]